MIEKVGYTRPATRPSNVRRTSATSATGFAEALEAAEGVGSSGGVEAAGGVAGISGIGGLIGIQEVSEEEVRKRKAVKRGRLTLDALTQLRDGILSGTLPIHTLQQLEKLVEEERAQMPDPILKGILDEIELRAAVELAKLEVAGIIPPKS